MLIETKFAAVLMNARFISVETFSGRGLMARDPQGVSDFHSLDVVDEVLGRSLAEALKASRWISMDEYAAYFNHDKLKREADEWLASTKERFGYKNRKAVFTGMANCTIRERDGLITIKPTRHEKLEGWSGDGIPESDRVVLSSASGGEALGQGVRLALSRCR